MFECEITGRTTMRLCRSISLVVITIASLVSLSVAHATVADGTKPWGDTRASGSNTLSTVIGEIASYPRGGGGSNNDIGSSKSMPPSLAALVEEAVAANRKIVVVTGGVLSGIGKGVTASSIGVLFRAMGLRVTALKIDPYLNVDAGTMSPFEHGEVFVLDDGGETDLDLGNYERFLSVCLTKESNLSTGKIYQSVIEKERIGNYLGKTVQVVPHVSDAIQEWVLNVAKTPVTHFSTAMTNKNRKKSSGWFTKREKTPEVCIVELGGTLGDIESMPFVEALRQLQEHLGYKNMCFVHVSLVPVLGSPSEQKTKPTQHSVKQMMQLGLRPDFLCCRGKEPLEPSAKTKLSLFTSVPENAIISIHDVSNIYRVPLMMMEQDLPSMLAQRLRIHPYAKRGTAYATRNRTGIRSSTLIKSWTKLADSVDDPESKCIIGMVGKYCDQGDAYLSVVKALTHSAIATNQKLRIEWIDASDLVADDEVVDEEASKRAWERLTSCDGIVVPGGFGTRGFDGKVAAIRHARESKTPFLGICLGMQAAVIEYTRNILGRPGAHSTEFVETGLEENVEDVVIFMPEGDRERMGGTMRLGARETLLQETSIARKMYDSDKVMERHRHRYEVNPLVVPELEEAGLRFVGKNTDESGERMEVVELPDSVHPYFVGAQFHPEFTSRPEKPNPLFLGLLQASKKHQADKANSEEKTVTSYPPVEEDALLEKCPDATDAERSRFLTARGGDRDKATDQLQMFLEWRAIHNLDSSETLTDSLLQANDDSLWEYASKKATSFDGLGESLTLPKLVRINVDSKTNEEIRASDGTRLIQVLPGLIDSDLAPPATYALAVALYLDAKISRDSMEKVTVLVDVRAGEGWPNQPAYTLLPFVRTVVHLLNHYFPERLSRCLLYPLPTLSRWIWELAKPFLDDKVSRIVVMNGPAKQDSPSPKEMRKYISEPVLEALEAARRCAFVANA